jgi:hypothetical protein
MGHKRKNKARKYAAGDGAGVSVWKSAKESARAFVDGFTGKDLNSKDAKALSGVKGGKGHSAYHCHTGPVKIGAYRDMELWAGARAEKWGAKDGAWALVIDLTGLSHGPFVSVSPEADRLMGGKFRPREREPFISIDWPDGGVPWQLGQSDWESLVAALGEINGKVFVHCLGGHGRTGTAISILATKMGMVPEGDDPVQWLRKRYCEDAVETNGQIKYIERITGRQVLERASDLYKYGEYAEYGKWDSAEQKWVDATKPAQTALPLGPAPVGNIAANTTILGPRVGQPINNELWTFMQEGKYKVYREGKAFIVSTNAAGDITDTREIDKATAGYDPKPLVGGYVATEGNPSDD